MTKPSDRNINTVVQIEDSDSEDTGSMSDSSYSNSDTDHSNKIRRANKAKLNKHAAMMSDDDLDSGSEEESRSINSDDTPSPNGKKAKSRCKWTTEEVEQLKNAVKDQRKNKQNNKRKNLNWDWAVIAKTVCTKTADQCKTKYNNDRQASRRSRAASMDATNDGNAQGGSMDAESCTNDSETHESQQVQSSSSTSCTKTVAQASAAHADAQADAQVDTQAGVQADAQATSPDASNAPLETALRRFICREIKSQVELTMTTRLGDSHAPDSSGPERIQDTQSVPTGTDTTNGDSHASDSSGPERIQDTQSVPTDTTTRKRSRGHEDCDVLPAPKSLKAALASYVAVGALTLQVAAYVASRLY